MSEIPRLVRKSLAVILTLGLVGCASAGGWEPTVDSYGSQNYGALGRDRAECRQLALHASGGTARQTVQGALVGGAIGAAAGAAIGAAVGNPGTGAAIGAATGGFSGGTHQGLSAEHQFKRAYINCMRGRGHRVINY